MCLAMISLPFCQTYECVMASSVFWGFFAGGIPGNGPMVYSESFKKDLASSQGLASIGRALAALSMGPLASRSKSQHSTYTSRPNFTSLLHRSHLNKGCTHTFIMYYCQF